VSIWKIFRKEAHEGVVKELTDIAFDVFLAENSRAVVEIYLGTCPHCMRMAPIYERVAKRSSHKATFARIESRTHPGTARRYQVSSAPTFLFFRDGANVASVVGEMSQTELEHHVVTNFG
jgi:thioredoxin-like negative regulator of GroEL